uniref:Benzoate 4-monooxygenase cytochrome P450 n=1 Tax=Coccidioides posadasii RMSCC 3488 TaxID=454284 RepID=A0A0J6I321_COCPO|nr:hypothetical protein CPAG_02095 [Coccidioides posadasii RMSCC 3488]
MAFVMLFTALSLPKWQLLALGLGIWVALDICRGIFRVVTSPFPGPRIAKFTRWWMRWKQWKGNDKHEILLLHRKYGPTVQLGPREVSFCHADALPQIYSGPRGLDAGESLLAFQNYASENVVTTLDADLHAVRRKMVVGLYTGPAVAAPAFQAGFKIYIEQFMRIIEERAVAAPCRTVDVSSWLRWLVADIIIHYIYGEKDHPNMLINEESRKIYKGLLITTADILCQPFVTFLGWFPRISTLFQRLFGPDEIGTFGMKRVEAVLSANSETKEHSITHLQHLTSTLKKNGPSRVLPGKNFIASDCLDHFIAGYFAPGDLLAALMWELSAPENRIYQDKLRHELHDAGILPGKYPDPSLVQRLPYLDCVLREVLRLHLPLPFGLPRTVKQGQNVVVLGTKIPAGTTIHSQGYCLHRDPDAFQEPERWNPERWNIPITSPKYREMQRMFWPFGSGARMCSGKNVAWAELRLITARVYSTYQTALDEVFVDKDGTLLPEEKRKAYFPFKITLPIRFLKL